MSESDLEHSELPLDGAGTRLKRAREAAGLSLADVAARTRIAERHLITIEAGNFNALASRAYAVGFARSFAREVGLDEHEIARAVRVEVDGQEPLADRYQPADFEPGDPARVPPGRLALIAGLSALAVVVAGYIFWRSFYAPAAPLPDLAVEASASASPDIAASAAPVAAGPVVFTALEPGIWVKFYDAAGIQLLQKQLAQGETYTVPADANGPMIRTARPEALQITIGGQVVPRLADKQMTIGDVPVSAAALLARGQAPAAPAAGAVATASAAPTPAPVASASASPSPRPTPTRAAQQRETPRPSPSPTASRAAPSPAPAATPSTPIPAATTQSSTVSQ